MNTLRLTRIKHHFSDNSLIDIKGALSKELQKFRSLIKPGASIALAVGSRGINNSGLIVQEVADFIMANNAYPFIIPAMGSHGEAIAEGQTEILAGYGITEKNIGIPVKSSMEVVELPQGDSPVPVFMDKNAYESDGIIMINRIKLHTDFHGKYESGLVKMSVIGLGKEKQASAVHRYGVYGLTVLMPIIAKQVFSSGKILGGIALVENAYDETMVIKALKTEEIFEEEPALLNLSRENMPSLPIDDIDVLIIDKIGKDISGVGLDPNIIGRIKITGQKEPERPGVKAIVLTDLTENSHGNAIGIGLSDVITRKLYNKISFPATYTNIRTSNFLERAKVPFVAENDKEAFELALRSCGFINPGEEKVIRIKNTLHLDEMFVSQAVLNILRDKPGIEIIKENANMFNSENEFVTFE
jgi:hypothetical protein